ncbi:pollen-specific leucine-rich repeat extensin-like protein 1 [Lactuca sativa]|uniref:pollen-specific leucine-rich repeat extensin-like protein 1 n=1 Tax=Lactuca sativa TaxID=4236 RepID=UPI000CD92DCF|nr:pollen-specific leucine-rich repeat extensin-like protein 1 [Lactuca sativa]
MVDYRKLIPSGPHQLTPEMQSALEAADKPAKRGKKLESKKAETEGPSSPKKRKADKAAPPAPKKKNGKKMAKRPKVPTSSSSNEEGQSADEEEEVQHEGSPRGNTPPRSSTPEVQIHVPTPPPSPKQTTIPIFVAPIPPPVTSQPTTTVPLPPPIFSSATTTTTTGPSVSVNVSDTGAHTVSSDTPVTIKPLSPSPSTDFEPILGGENFDFDSTYYSPYRIPSEDNDDDAPVTKLHLKDIHDKLDKLLGSLATYSDVVLNAFLDTTLQQYTASIDNSTKVVDASTSTCKKAATKVTYLV